MTVSDLLRVSIRDAADAEIDAMHDAYVALSRVTPAGRMRALDWLNSRIGWEQRVGVELAETLGKTLRQIEKAVARERRRRRPALAAAARQGGDVKQAPGEAPQSGDAKQRNAQGPSHD